MSLKQVVERIRGRKLQERNARIFKNEPLCRMHKAKGEAVAATEVDHIVALCNGGTEAESNLQPLCHDCNELKGIAERGDRARAYEIKGLDWIA